MPVKDTSKALGSPDTLKWAAAYVAENVGPGRTILAAVSPTPEQIKESIKIPWLFYFPPFFLSLPMWWSVQKEFMDNLKYKVSIVTDSEIVLVYKDMPKNLTTTIRMRELQVIKYDAIEGVCIEGPGIRINDVEGPPYKMAYGEDLQGLFNLIVQQKTQKLKGQ